MDSIRSKAKSFETAKTQRENAQRPPSEIQFSRAPILCATSVPPRLCGEPKPVAEQPHNHVAQQRHM